MLRKVSIVTSADERQRHRKKVQKDLANSLLKSLAALLAIVNTTLLKEKNIDNKALDSLPFDINISDSLDFSTFDKAFKFLTTTVDWNIQTHSISQSTEQQANSHLDQHQKIRAQLRFAHKAKAQVQVICEPNAADCFTAKSKSKSKSKYAVFFKKLVAFIVKNNCYSPPKRIFWQELLKFLENFDDLEAIKNLQHIVATTDLTRPGRFSQQAHDAYTITAVLYPNQVPMPELLQQAIQLEQKATIKWLNLIAHLEHLSFSDCDILINPSFFNISQHSTNNWDKLVENDLCWYPFLLFLPIISQDNQGLLKHIIEKQHICLNKLNAINPTKNEAEKICGQGLLSRIKVLRDRLFVITHHLYLQRRDCTIGNEKFFETMSYVDKDDSETIVAVAKSLSNKQTLSWLNLATTTLENMLVKAVDYLYQDPKFQHINNNCSSTLVLNRRSE